MGITSALLTIYLNPRKWKIYFGNVKELIAILLHWLLSLNNVHKNCHLLMSLSVGVLCLLARLQISLFKIILSKWEPLHNQNKINNHVGEEMSRAICSAEMPYFSKGFKWRPIIFVMTLWIPWVSAPCLRIRSIKLRADIRKKLYWEVALHIRKISAPIVE